MYAVPTIAPDNVNISALNATAVYLSWDGVITRVGIIRDYIIRVSEVDTGTKMEYRTSFTFLTIPVHPDYVYSCSVSAFTVASGPFSDVVTIRAPQDGMFCGYYGGCVYNRVISINSTKWNSIECQRVGDLLPYSLFILGTTRCHFEERRDHTLHHQCLCG